jgi:hypothetical protein
MNRNGCSKSSIVANRAKLYPQAPYRMPALQNRDRKKP